MAERDKEVAPGSWDMSGTESQRMMRLDEAPPVVTATQMLEEIASAPADNGVDELPDAGEVGRDANCACPAYSA